jgi:hypothetical protein
MLSRKQKLRLPKPTRHRRGMNRQQLLRWAEKKYTSGVFTDGEIESMQMIARAVRLGFELDPRAWELATQKMQEVMSKQQDAGKVIAAASVIVEMAKVNVKLEALDQKDRHHAEGELVHHVHSEQYRSGLVEVARQLGVDPSVIAIPCRDADGSSPATGHSQNGNGKAH